MAISHYSVPRTSVPGNTSQNLVTDPYLVLLLEYEARKRAWTAKHPDATPAAYEAAMRNICRSLGV